MALLTLALEQGKVRFITACVRSWADGGRPLCVCVCVCVAALPSLSSVLLDVHGDCTGYWGGEPRPATLTFTALISELCPGFRVWMSY